MAVSPARFLTHWPQMTLSDDSWQEAVHGRTLAGPVQLTAAHALAVNQRGDLVAVLKPDPSAPGRWRPVKVLAGASAPALSPTSAARTEQHHHGCF